MPLGNAIQSQLVLVGLALPLNRVTRYCRVSVETDVFHGIRDDAALSLCRKCTAFYTKHICCGCNTNQALLLAVSEGRSSNKHHAKKLIERTNNIALLGVQRSIPFVFTVNRIDQSCLPIEEVRVMM